MADESMYTHFKRWASHASAASDHYRETIPKPHGRSMWSTMKYAFANRNHTYKVGGDSWGYDTGQKDYGAQLLRHPYHSSALAWQLQKMKSSGDAFAARYEKTSAEIDSNPILSHSFYHD